MGVKIREKRGRLYLDIYVNGIRRWEALKLTVPSDPRLRKEVERLAETIRIKREMQLASAEYDIHDLIAAKQDLISYANKLAEGQPPKNPLPKSLKYLRKYAGNIAISAISERWVKGYRAFLLGQATIGSNSAGRYMAALKHILNQAVRERMLPRSPADNVEAIPETEPETEYLQHEEMERLASTPLESTPLRLEVRKAFLLSLNTGLRISDLQSLRWGSIERDPLLIRKQQTKTRKGIVIPITAKTFKIVDDGKIHNRDELVFPELASTKQNTNRLLREWGERAGILKRLTWHVARRSFGTAALRAGGDLATVSRLLGHTSLQHTQRYLKVDLSSMQRVIDAMPEINSQKGAEIIQMRKVEGGEV